MYKLEDRWTTRDGKWEVTGEMYGIDQAHLDQWGNERIEGKGCAHCIFVKLEGGPEDTVRFFTDAGYSEEHPIDANRWAHATMYNPGSGYNPTKVKGPWSVMAQDQSEVVDDIGMPAGEHVSHFVVLKWVEEDTAPGPDPVPDPVPTPDSFQVAIKIGDSVYSGLVKKVEG